MRETCQGIDAVAVQIPPGSPARAPGAEHEEQVAEADDAIAGESGRDACHRNAPSVCTIAADPAGLA